MLLYTLAFSALVAGALGAATRHVPKPTLAERHPYQVSLELLMDNKFRHVCGGSIIGDSWVLTTAQCVLFLYNFESYPLQIRAGSSYVERDGDLYSVSDFFLYPNSSINEEFEIGLIKVAKPFTFSEKVSVIPIATETPAMDSTVLTTGWGNNHQCESDQVHVGSLTIMDKRECEEIYKFPEPLPESFRCAVDKRRPLGYLGETGGPVIYDSKLYGVVFVGYGCQDWAYPVIYNDITTKVSSWISYITKNN